MKYTGRIFIVLIYIFIVLGWHTFYFIMDADAAFTFMFVEEQYKWDLVFIPLLSPVCWLLGFQYDKAKYFSEMDTLTGLYNRRYIGLAVPKLLQQMARKNKRLAISIIDCDEFKQINDRMGHKMGDSILKQVSVIFSKSAGPGAIVARWGGDEFLIVLPNATRIKTKEIEEKIGASFAQLSKTTGTGLSVSIGTAIFPDDADTMKDLLVIADRKMYGNKGTKNVREVRYMNK